MRELQHEYSEDDVLMHYGVLGMKWGVRKDNRPQGFQYGKKGTKKKNTPPKATKGSMKKNRTPEQIAKSQKRTSTLKKVGKTAGSVAAGAALAAGVYAVSNIARDKMNKPATWKGSPVKINRADDVKKLVKSTLKANAELKMNNLKGSTSVKPKSQESQALNDFIDQLLGADDFKKAATKAFRPAKTTSPRTEPVKPSSKSSSSLMPPHIRTFAKDNPAIGAAWLNAQRAATLGDSIKYTNQVNKLMDDAINKVQRGGR